MGQSQSDETPKPGDLIEITRVAYQHWAVYVGDGYVVHVTSPPEDESSVSEISDAASNTLTSVPTEKALVRKQRLEVVVGDDTWRINNSLDKKIKPRPSHIIVKEALGQVGNVMEYSVTSENCEHFASKLRYGIAVSWQVTNDAEVAAGFAPPNVSAMIVLWLPVTIVAAAVLISRR